MEKYIYKITNLLNHKIYIGQTNNPKRREREHFSLSMSILKDNKNKLLYQAMLKYGPEHFVFEIIENKTEKYNEREKYWIKYYNCIKPQGYNMTEGGDEPPHFKGEEHPMAYHSQQQIKEIQDLLKSTSLTFEEIGLQYNYSISSIQRINSGMLWYNENIAYPIRIQTNSSMYRQERAENIIYDLLNTTLTQKEIAKKYNVTRTVVTAINNGQNFFSKEYTYPIRKQDCHSKPVLMIDKKTKMIIQEFSSAVAAATFLGNKDYSKNISRCANGYHTTAYGYIWRHKNK